ncbi:MAG TPA: Gfo/Idh/MocA family oxidoreductase [Candidatus Acidoferrales bacterium]|nr:Gfo/Idh/MocA family oxidoreductase [Candidatus Acidoferrales bacterium]
MRERSDAMVRLAVVGFGRLARNYYAPALRAIPGAEICAIADSLAASRDAAHAAFPAARIYADYRELLAHEQIDALVVASPPSTHLGVWNEAARRGIPVLMEKPFVLGGELERAASSAEARALLMPNFNRRLWPDYRAMRQLCIGGSLGAIESAHFALRIDLRPWCSVTRHRLSAGEGGALFDLGSSQLDLIEYVLGAEIASLEAASAKVEPSGEGVVLSVLLGNGVPVRCEIGYSTRNRESVAIVGARASVVLANPNTALHVTPRGSGKFPLMRFLRDSIVFGNRAVFRGRSMLRYTIRASLAEFVDAVAAGRPFSPGFDDAAHNCACLEAAQRSVAERRPIEIKPPANHADVREAST